jgi:hypothetical protein
VATALGTLVAVVLVLVEELTSLDGTNQVSDDMLTKAERI